MKLMNHVIFDMMILLLSFYLKIACENMLIKEKLSKFNWIFVKAQLHRLTALHALVHPVVPAVLANILMQ
jgi:hypothetical protein